jgi:DNA-binding XRE family transcriptional regulator
MSNIFDILSIDLQNRLMNALQELGHSVRQRRTDIALTQATLAQLSGLSRATINQIETGTIRDLSLSRTVRLLNVVGLKVQVSPARERLLVATPSEAPRSALALAAQTASVSLRSALSAAQVRDAFCTGEIEPDFLPHVFTLLDEAPVSLLARVVEELHAQTGAAHAAVWRTMRQLARRLKSGRALWQ